MRASGEWPLLGEVTSRRCSSPQQLAARWGMHDGSILRKLRQRELPILMINARSIRVLMKDVLAYEARNSFGFRK